jgi:hypothetical protein
MGVSTEEAASFLEVPLPPPSPTLLVCPMLPLVKIDRNSEILTFIYPADFSQSEKLILLI